MYSPDQLQELMAASDYVVMATPHTPATDKMVRGGAGRAQLLLPLVPQARCPSTQCGWQRLHLHLTCCAASYERRLGPTALQTCTLGFLRPVASGLPCPELTHGVPNHGAVHLQVGAAAIAAMRPHSVFINLGRGKCVDEKALIAGTCAAGAAVYVRTCRLRRGRPCAAEAAVCWGVVAAASKQCAGASGRTGGGVGLGACAMYRRQNVAYALAGTCKPLRHSPLHHSLTPLSTTLLPRNRASTTALQEGRIRGAALDVFETEPLPADSPLWGLDNVLMSPHCADRTKEFQVGAASAAAGVAGNGCRGSCVLNGIE